MSAYMSDITVCQIKERNQNSWHLKAIHQNDSISYSLQALNMKLYSID